MGKFEPNNNRGGSFNRGGGRGGFSRGGGRGGRGGRGGFDQGPPAFVVPYGTYLHKCENAFVVKVTDPTRVPKFNRGIYLESKAKVGSVDEILGPTSAFYFSVKPAEGIKADGFKEGQVFYMNPEDLLPIDRWTKKSTPGPKGPRSGPRPGGAPQRGGFSGRGGAPQRGGFNSRGGRGGFTGGARTFNKPIGKWLSDLLFVYPRIKNFIYLF